MSATRIIVVKAERGEPIECSLAEFLAANSDGLEIEQIDELNAAIDRGETYRIGGGAAPLIEIRSA